MNLSNCHDLSYFKEIAAINEPHNIYLVQHQESKKVYIKKILFIYNRKVYEKLYQNPIPGIPRILAIYEEDSHLTVIEEYISGRTLEEIINSNDLTSQYIIQYTEELCNILKELHAFCPPIIHRDIKPSNIIVTSSNHIVLIDFNAAKEYSEIESSDTVLLGTKGYAAPEQYGFGSSSLQTDIYAMGILLKEMAASLVNSTDQFDYAIAKCTQLNPKDRFINVEELKNNLIPQNSAHSQLPAKQQTPNYIPPGYRSKTPWKMIFASFMYVCLASFFFTLNFPKAHGALLWVERLFCFLMALAIIAGSFNYLYIQDSIPLCRSKNKFLHYIGIIILDTILVLLLFIMLCLIESTFFPS